MSVVALVPAAGSGERLGLGVAKAFVPLGERPMLWHAVRGVLAAGCVDAVVVAVPSPSVTGAVEVLRSLGGMVAVVAGGADRVASVRRALDHAGSLHPGVEVVLVHDAARPLTPPAVFAAVVAAVRAGHGAVVPVVPLVDTVKRVDAAGRVLDTVDRSTLRAVQTPQGFAPEVLRRAHAAVAGAAGLGAAVCVTDDAGLVEALGEPVHTVAGDPMAFKITTAFDLATARALLGGVASPAPRPPRPAAPPSPPPAPPSAPFPPFPSFPPSPSAMWASQRSLVEQWDAHTAQGVAPPSAMWASQGSLVEQWDAHTPPPVDGSTPPSAGGRTPPPVVGAGGGGS